MNLSTTGLGTSGVSTCGTGGRSVPAGEQTLDVAVVGAPRRIGGSKEVEDHDSKKVAKFCRVALFGG